MSATYHCDGCGCELFSPWHLNSSNPNTDGYKTFDSNTNRWLDLCNDCKMKLYNNELNINFKPEKVYGFKRED